MWMLTKRTQHNYKSSGYNNFIQLKGLPYNRSNPTCKTTKGKNTARQVKSSKRQQSICSIL